jgi:fermentation-respiration switch protein FrsA (DUF1100 family)
VAQRVTARSLGWVLATLAVLFAALALTTTALLALVALALIGFVNGAGEVIFATTIQQEADAAYHGRAFAFSSTVLRTTMLAAIATAPLVNAVARPAVAIVGAGAFVLVAALVVLAGTSRAARVVAEPVAA